MIVYDVATIVLDTESFPQHNIAGLISGIKFIVFFQSGEAFMVEGNKHTHTHTQSNRVNIIRETFIIYELFVMFFCIPSLDKVL